MCWERSHHYLTSIYNLCNHDVTQAPFSQVYIYMCSYTTMCSFDFLRLMARSSWYCFRMLERADCRRLKDIEGDSFVNRSVNVPVFYLASSPRMKSFFVSHPSAAESYWADLSHMHLQFYSFRTNADQKNLTFDPSKTHVDIIWMTVSPSGHSKHHFGLKPYVHKDNSSQKSIITYKLLYIARKPVSLYSAYTTCHCLCPTSGCGTWASARVFLNMITFLVQ